MSNAMKSNIFHTISWGVTAIGIIIIFSLPNTIYAWGENRLKTILLALLFLFGFAVDLIIRINERTKKYGYKKDERDRTIQMEAVFKSFVSILLYIFILSIVLYITHEKAGMIPVGWVWFIAYSTVAFSNLLIGIFTIGEYRSKGM